jgi:hypothetical protein
MKKKDNIFTRMKKIVRKGKWNKKAVSRGPGLTWFAIGLVVFIGVIVLLYNPEYGLYPTFLQANGVSPSGQYDSTYNNITANIADIDTWTSGFTFKSFFSTLLQMPGIVLNSFAIGFSAIRTFTQVPLFFNSMFNTLQETLHIPAILSWMIVTIVAIYFASKFIKAMRGTIDDI